MFFYPYLVLGAKLDGSCEFSPRYRMKRDLTLEGSTLRSRDNYYPHFMVEETRCSRAKWNGCKWKYSKSSPLTPGFKGLNISYSLLWESIFSSGKTRAEKESHHGELWSEKECAEEKAVS